MFRQQQQLKKKKDFRRTIGFKTRRIQNSVWWGDGSSGKTGFYDTGSGQFHSFAFTDTPAVMSCDPSSGFRVTHKTFQKSKTKCSRRNGDVQRIKASFFFLCSALPVISRNYIFFYFKIIESHMNVRMYVWSRNTLMNIINGHSNE